MNILGHAYVSFKVTNRFNKYLAAGSLLPESSPYIKNNPFAFEEIHEGGDKFLKYLKKKDPQKKDLAFGMIIHSAKFGADMFNKEIESLVGDKRKDFLKEIALASGVNLKIAEYRLHNFLWLGMDTWILYHYPKFVKRLQKAISEVEIDVISKLLSDAFKKNYDQALATCQALFQNIYQPKDLGSLKGLIHIWARQASGLPEKDEVKVKRACLLVEEIYLSFENKWKQILNMVVKDVHKNTASFLR